MQQISTPTSWPNAKRNAAVVTAKMWCQALDCERDTTRWSNLCGLCEKQWLEDHKPVLGSQLLIKSESPKLASSNDRGRCRSIFVVRYFLSPTTPSTIDDMGRPGSCCVHGAELSSPSVSNGDLFGGSTLRSKLALQTAARQDDCPPTAHWDTKTLLKNDSSPELAGIRLQARPTQPKPADIHLPSQPRVPLLTLASRVAG